MNAFFNIEVHQSSGGQKYIAKGSISKDFSKSEWFRYYTSESSEFHVFQFLTLVVQLHGMAD